MIGQVYISIFKYYDSRKKGQGFKKRPVLIVGQSDSTDYVVLPISRITDSNYIDGVFDIAVDPVDFPLMNLVRRSYIRTHKQTVVHIGELMYAVVDLQAEYPDLYLDVLEKMSMFQERLLSKAL